jgi:hypothetical protein
MFEFLGEFLGEHKTATGLVIAAGLWLWRNKAQLMRMRFRDAVDAAVTEAGISLLDSPLTRSEIASRLAEAAWGEAADLGIVKPGTKKKPPSWARNIVDTAVREGLAEVAERLHKREVAMQAAREIQSNLAKAAADAQKAVDAFTPPPPEERTVPPLEGVTFEEVDELPKPEDTSG